MEAFFKLLNAAIRGENAPEMSLTEEEWENVFKLAKKHTVIGLVFCAAMTLPPEMQPPRRVKVRMALLSEKIQARNSEMNAALPQLYADLKDMGLRSCLLKGQGIALLYPNPDMRQCGDIDMWVEGDWRTILKSLASRWKVGEVWYHHADVRVFGKSPQVEMHFYPSWMNSPIYNRRFHRYLAEKGPEQFGNFNEKLGCCVPTVEFNLVFSMLHIYRHLLSEGVGLRQLTDYFMILCHSNQQQRRHAMEQLRHLGLGDFVPSVMYVLHKCFALDDEFLLCPMESRGGSFLLEEVLAAGNFGFLDSRNKWRHNQNVFVKAIHRYQHLSRFVMYAPSEVLWSPYFKLRQFFWKRIHRFK